MMKKYTLLGHVFELEDNAYHFLARYVERIENYSINHAVAIDVIDDIKYSLIEKLYACDTPITEKQVIEIANSLGEPEVMFDETAENAPEKITSKKPNILNKEKPVIRGVCYRLAKSMNIPVMIMRIIFLVLILVNGAGMILYVILALFVPYKDKKKTTGVIGNILFEFVRVIFRLIILSIVLPLTFAALAGTGIMLFTPAIENQLISPWIPQYMYVTGALMSIAFLLLSIGTVGSLFKQRRLNKSLGLLAAIVIVMGGVVTIGTGYKTVMQAMNHKTTVEQSMVFPGDLLTGDRVNIDMTKITDYTESRSHFGVGSADVRIIRTTGSQVSIQIKTTLRGQSDSQLADTVSKLQPLQITGDANNVLISREGKLFTSEVPFAGVHRHIVIAVPSDKEVFLNKDRRTNMYVQNDGLGRGYCAAKVYVYNPNIDEFTCKNGSGEVFYDIEDEWEEALEDRIGQRVQDRIEQRRVENNEQGFDAVPPMYPQE